MQILLSSISINLIHFNNYNTTKKLHRVKVLQKSKVEAKDTVKNAMI